MNLFYLNSLFIYFSSGTCVFMVAILLHVPVYGWKSRILTEQKVHLVSHLKKCNRLISHSSIQVQFIIIIIIERVEFYTEYI